MEQDGVDLDTTPVLYLETVDQKTYVSDLTNNEIQLFNDVQDLDESFDIRLNTDAQVGLILGSFPTIDRF